MADTRPDKDVYTMTDVEAGEGADSVASEVESPRTDIDQVGQSDRFYDEVWESKRPHRRGVIAFAVVGILAFAGGYLLPETRSVLVALGGIGIFGAVLLKYLLPARFISAATSESIYTAFSATSAELIETLELHDERIYVPNTTENTPTRLFVPTDPEAEIPESGMPTSLFVYGNDNELAGISVLPIGWLLYREFNDSIQPTTAEEPTQLAEQIADALTNQFELVNKASSEGERGYVVFTINYAAYGPVDRFDHPIPSFSAVTLASELQAPVRIKVMAGERARNVRIICSWNEQQAQSTEAA